MWLDEEFDALVARFASEAGGVIYVVKVKEESEGMSRYFPYPMKSYIFS